MTDENWSDPNGRSLCLYLDGSDDPDRAADGACLSTMISCSWSTRWWEPLDFVVPPTRPGQSWHREVDTFDPASVSPTPNRPPRARQSRSAPGL